MEKQTCDLTHSLTLLLHCAFMAVTNNLLLLTFSYKSTNKKCMTIHHVPFITQQSKFCIFTTIHAYFLSCTYCTDQEHDEPTITGRRHRAIHFLCETQHYSNGGHKVCYWVVFQVATYIQRPPKGFQLAGDLIISNTYRLSNNNYW